MRWLKPHFVLAMFVVAGCEISPVDTRLVSTVPADAQSFAIAERAVRACTDVTNAEKVRRNFQRAGFEVTVQMVQAKTGRTIQRTLI